MEFSKYFSLITLAVSICVIAHGQADASPIGDALEQRYQADLDDFDKKAAIGGAGNIVIQLGQAAIKEIEEDAAFYKAAGACAEAVDVLTDGLILTIKLIAENGDDAFDVIDKYKGADKNMHDPEEAIDDIDREIRRVKESIYHSGVGVLHAMGAAGVIAPNVTKAKIKEMFDPIQDSGTAIFEGMEAAQTLATLGIKSAQRSRDQSMKASHNAVLAGVSALNSCFNKAAKRQFAYLANVANGTTSEVDATGNALSARAKAIARDNETLSVIEEIDSSIFKAVVEGISIAALNEIREGILGDIETSARGISKAFKAVEDAKKIAETNPEKALQVTAEGFEAARKGCIDGSVQGYQAFGGAGYLVGHRKVFALAIEDIESSRIGATGGIRAARKLARMGIIAGGSAIEIGLTAAHDALEAVEIELFTKIANAQNVALKVLKAVTKLPGLI